MNSHLTPQQMLAYVDGELSETEALHAADHLRGCKSCFTDIEQLKKDLATTKDALSKPISQSVPSAPQPWESLETLVARKKTKRGSAPSRTARDGSQKSEPDSE
jgi:anti-sigma factor RsiW